ncbi:50S ribosomal protein L2 [Candidatus Woesearchaeota archaeon]|nr:50S ribosomal protein L2 [Candidatus Woesearchaeota archaeon]
MGKRIIQQRRGRGTHTYKSPSHRFKGSAKHPTETGEVIDIVNCPGHSAPLISIAQSNGKKALSFAPEGIKLGDQIQVGETEIKMGSVHPLKDIPEGTAIHNIEAQPGDGGKFVRASGTFAKLITQTKKSIIIKLPSRKEKLFHPDCRATIGIIAGSGRPDKPFLKAGTRHFKRKARNRLYPSVSGTSMNAVDHPFGGSSSAHKGKPTVAPKHAPPGRKVGKLKPRRTGKQK